MLEHECCCRLPFLVYDNVVTRHHYALLHHWGKFSDAVLHEDYVSMALKDVPYLLPPITTWKPCGMWQVRPAFELEERLAAIFGRLAEAT